MRVLMLDLDTLRPDHLSCYGYERETSPFIDSICEEGVRFDNYYCPDAPCLPSRAALISGRFGIHNGAVGHGGSRAEMFNQGETRGFRNFLDNEAMTNVFRKAGFHTCSISPFAERHSAFWFYAGFNEMYNTGKGGMESAEEVTPVVMDWLERNADSDNWFLHINYWDPHTPYRAPEEFGDPFKNDPLPSWITSEVLEEHKKAVGPHTANEIGMYNSTEDPNYPRHPGKIEDMKGLRRMVDGYDCGIRYVDSHIGKILDFLKAKGIYEDTAIIVTSDHGENMGELSIYGEHGTADNITCKIPMIIKWPGMKKGHVDKGFHYNMDLSPTLSDLLNVEPCERWDGKSYYGSLKDGVETGHDYLILSQMAHVCQRSVRFDDYLYIRTYHDGYHLFEEEMLFNIKEDPHEQNNLADIEKDVCHKASYLLNKWYDEMMLSLEGRQDPMITVIEEGGPFHAKGHLPSYIERLKETNRNYGIEPLLEKHKKEFIKKVNILD